MKPSARSTVGSEMRISKIVSGFKMSKAIFFCKVMTKTTATQVFRSGSLSYQLEFPNLFLVEHGDKFDENATLRRPACGRIWPMAISVRRYNYTAKKRVFAYGDGGWKAFVMENRINVGDLLIFSLVGFSRFLVHVYPNAIRVDDVRSVTLKMQGKARTTARITARTTASCGDNLVGWKQLGFHGEGLRWRRSQDVLDYLLKPLHELVIDGPEAYLDDHNYEPLESASSTSSEESTALTVNETRCAACGQSIIPLKVKNPAASGLKTLEDEDEAPACPRFLKTVRLHTQYARIFGEGMIGCPGKLLAEISPNAALRRDPTGRSEQSLHEGEILDVPRRLHDLNLLWRY